MLTRTTRAARTAMALLLLTVLLAPRAAWAHARLTRSAPAARAELALAPREITLWFSLPPEPAFTRVTLLREGGADTIPMSAATHVDGDALGVRLAIGSALAPGRYTVAWQSATSDGHPLRGRFTFVVLAADAAAPADTSAAATDTAVPAPADPHAGHAQPRDVARPAGAPATASDQDGTAPSAAEPVSLTGVTLRALGFGALLALVGAVVFRGLVLRGARAALDDDALLASASVRAAGVGLVASALLLAAAAGRLAEQARALPDPGGMLEGTMNVLTGTRWGAGWVLQVAAAILALVAFARARAARGAPDTHAGWTLASVAAAALAFTPALTGHAAAMGALAPLAIASDGFHVIGAAGWVGTLVVVAVAGLPSAALAGPRRGAAVAAMVNAFSPLALVFAAVAALTGLTSAAIHLGALDALWATRYGRAILVKLFLVSLVLAVGAWNWKRVRPGLPDGAAADRLEKTALLELTASLLVVLWTSVLTGVAPGRD